MRKILFYIFSLAFLTLALRPMPIKAAQADSKNLVYMEAAGVPGQAKVEVRLPEKNYDIVTTFQLGFIISGGVKDTDFVFAEDVSQNAEIGVKTFKYDAEAGTLYVYVSGRESIFHENQFVSLGTVGVTLEDGQDFARIEVIPDSFVTVDKVGNVPVTEEIAPENDVIEIDVYAGGKGEHKPSEPSGPQESGGSGQGGNSDSSADNNVGAENNSVESSSGSVGAQKPAGTGRPAKDNNILSSEPVQETKEQEETMQEELPAKEQETTVEADDAQEESGVQAETSSVSVIALTLAIVLAGAAAVAGGIFYYNKSR